MINATRKLTDIEFKIVLAMIDAGDPKFHHLKSTLSDCLVTVMNDGGMGGLQFEANSDSVRQLSTEVSEAEFYDSDDILVSMTLNLDQKGRLFELDIWKVDFKPLISLPDISNLVFK